MATFAEPELVLAVPHVRVQNANLLSSPITWGFPSPTALVGLGDALHRRVRDEGLSIAGVGVVCHQFDPQIARRINEPSLLRLTRNPLTSTGKPPSLIEEGRVHLELTFLFGLSGPALYSGDQAGELDTVVQTLAELRFAGGVFLPPDPRRRTSCSPFALSMGVGDSERRRFMRRLLPGFAMVSREGLLTNLVQQLRTEQPDASSFDALLELARLRHDCTQDSDDPQRGHWSVRRRKGWVVPITCGFRGISPLYAPGDVPGTRDAVTPFRFVEAIYTAGEWLSPHRVSHPADLLWYPEVDVSEATYRVSTPHYATQSDVLQQEA